MIEPKTLSSIEKGEKLMNKPLIFAPLIRVSTEGQVKKGESLNTQRKQLETAIESINGTVYKWYAGQEHATPVQERKILNELIHDAQHKKFDAIMVTDMSRWSRDNQKSKEHLSILRNHHIRFFVGTRELDLFSPTEGFLLGISVEVAEFFAMEQTYKSMINRIERAKKGHPACGKLPYGRYFDKDTKEWKIDETLQLKIQKIAEQYLYEDCSFKELGEKFGMNPTNLHKILIHRCGDKWEQRFRSKKLNIDLKVDTEIPRLLPDKIIERIQQKSQDRRVWDRKARRHRYLLSKMIFDKDTGYALTGTANQKGQRYYKPHQGRELRYQINANILEKAVLGELFDVLTNTGSLLNAVRNAYPGKNVENELKVKLVSLRKENRSVEKKLNNYAMAIEDFEGENLTGFLTNLKFKIQEFEQKKGSLNKEISDLEYKLSRIPNDGEIKNRRDWIRKQIIQRHKESFWKCEGALSELSFEDKRAVIKLIFGGWDENDKRYGIYVQHLGGKPRKYAFEAYGKMGSVKGTLQATTKKHGSYMNPDLDLKEDLLTDIAKLALHESPGMVFDNEVSSYMFSQRHAHYRIGLYQ